jgi:probable HAF family extracellular repeat protein
MRRSLSLLVGLLALASVAVASSGGATQAQPRWVIRDLGTLGGKESEAIAINNRGQVIGTSETGAEDGDGYPITHAFLWQKGKMIDLGTLPGRKHSVPTAINERGQVVGYSFPAYEPEDENPMRTHAFLWERGKMTDLGTFGDAASWSVAINDRSQVVVQTFRSARYLVSAHVLLWQRGRGTNLGPGSVNPFNKTASVLNEGGRVILERGFAGYLWRDGKATRIGKLPRDDHSSVHSINDHGQVIGSSFGKDGEEHAFLWQKGRMTRLGHLGLGSSSPAAINDRGQVVGQSYRAVGEPHGFLWRRGKVIDIGSGEAADINSQGQVVGTKWFHHASLWQSGRVFDLGTLPGMKYSDAIAINERGQIVGQSQWSGWGTKTEDPSGHAVLWTLTLR